MQKVTKVFLFNYLNLSKKTIGSEENFHQQKTKQIVNYAVNNSLLI